MAAVDFLDVVQEIKKERFSIRKRFFDILQFKVSLEVFGGGTALVAWPDVLFYVTPEMVLQAVEEATDPEPQKPDIRRLK